MRNVETEQIKNKAGEPFRIVRWPSKEKAKALLFIQHGLGEHGGRYQALADGLVDVPVDIWSFDARGHGESVGKRGDARDLFELADDMEEMLALALSRTGHDRAILMGHSMGGAVAAVAATTRTLDPRVKGLILSAPALTVTKNLNAIVKIAVGRVMARIKPTLTLPSGLDASGISSDKSEVERYKADPLVHDMLSVRLGMSLIDDAENAIAQAGKIHIPTLLYHGDADPIVDIDGTRRMSKGIGTDDVTYEELRGYQHEPHHETPDRRRALFDTLRTFITARL